jgi:hypothetical protein
MATTDITKPTEKSVSRPRDLFATMRDEMERVFDQLERGFPNWPGLFRRRNGEGAIVIPEFECARTLTQSPSKPSCRAWTRRM